MKKFTPLSLQANRIRTGNYASDDSYGLVGGFKVIGPDGALLLVMSSGPGNEDNDTGWEHVSVSCENRCPNWAEMCFVKDLFWGEEEMVVQYHPPKSAYVDYHPYCLHLWKPVEMSIPMPSMLLVGPKR
jgi:hypothetical protein